MKFVVVIFCKFRSKAHFDSKLCCWYFCFFSLFTLSAIAFVCVFWDGWDGVKKREKLELLNGNFYLLCSFAFHLDFDFSGGFFSLLTNDNTKIDALLFIFFSIHHLLQGIFHLSAIFTNLNHHFVPIPQCYTYLDRYLYVDKIYYHCLSPSDFSFSIALCHIILFFLLILIMKKRKYSSESWLVLSISLCIHLIYISVILIPICPVHSIPFHLAFMHSMSIALILCKRKY